MFDLDDTLLWDHKSVSEAFKTTCKTVEDSHNIDASVLEERVRYHAEQIYPTLDTYSFTSNIGIGTFEGMWGEFKDEGENFKLLRETVPGFRKRAWFEALKDVEIEDETLAEELAVMFPEERKRHIYLYEETLDVLNALKDDYKLLMLTNGSPDLQHMKLSYSPELAPYFDHIVIPGAFGQGKPSVDIFNYALSLLELEKGEIIMIGDNPNTDILGASRVGIDSVWINHHDRELTDVTPTYEVSRLKEILKIIESYKK